MTSQTFEAYLQAKHADQYVGTDDDMPDSFNVWLCELDVDDWLTYGQLFAEREKMR